MNNAGSKMATLAGERPRLKILALGKTESSRERTQHRPWMRCSTEADRGMIPALQTRVFELKDVISLLRSEVKRAGGQAEWARQTGISRTMLNKVLNGHKLPAMTIIAALKLRIVFVSDPNSPKRTTARSKRGPAWI
jgi:DNA-binding phage protein